MNAKLLGMLGLLSMGGVAMAAEAAKKDAAPPPAKAEAVPAKGEAKPADAKAEVKTEQAAVAEAPDAGTAPMVKTKKGPKAK